MFIWTSQKLRITWQNYVIHIHLTNPAQLQAENDALESWHRISLALLLVLNSDRFCRFVFVKKMKSTSICKNVALRGRPRSGLQKLVLTDYTEPALMTLHYIIFLI